MPWPSNGPFWMVPLKSHQTQRPPQISTDFSTALSSLAGWSLPAAIFTVAFQVPRPSCSASTSLDGALALASTALGVTGLLVRLRVTSMSCASLPPGGVSQQVSTELSLSLKTSWFRMRPLGELLENDHVR